MKVIEINGLKPAGEEVANFQGFKHGADVSFFLVQFTPGKGPDKHRHPYEETVLLLEGEIEVIVDAEVRMVGSNSIVVIPANTWHEFKARSEPSIVMVNIHPVPKMITEWA